MIPGADGRSFTVTTVEAFGALLQPFASVIKYLMVVCPEFTASTTPAPFTVAIASLSLNQTPPAFAFANFTKPPIHTEVGPVIAATVGSGFTRIFLETAVTQPAILLTV